MLTDFHGDEEIFFFSKKQIQNGSLKKTDIFNSLNSQKKISVENVCIVVCVGVDLHGFHLWPLLCDILSGHGLRTANEGMNHRNLKFWADLADEICFGRT